MNFYPVCGIAFFIEEERVGRGEFCDERFWLGWDLGVGERWKRECAEQQELKKEDARKHCGKNKELIYFAASF
jgi:hypothetical protein